jgi:hypothetical protein
MKSRIVIFLLALSLLSPGATHAQLNCSSVNDANVADCCAEDNIDRFQQACDDYQNGLIGVTPIVPVGSTSSCNPITDYKYMACCYPKTTVPSGTSLTALLEQDRQCKSYEPVYCKDHPNASMCAQGTLGGGTIGTAPVNGGVATGIIAPTPQSSSAELASCSTIRFDSLLDILIWLKCVIAAVVIPFIFMLAFLFFLWGMVQYIRNADNEKKRQESKKFMYYGILGLTVMVSVWGIVRIVNSTFGFGNTVPELQTDYLKK